MRTDELCKRIRRVAFIGSATAYPEYGTLVLLDEMNDRMRSVFGEAVISARSGYWLTTATFSGNVAYGQQRIPARAANGGLEAVEVLSNGQYFHIREMSPREAAEWESSTTVQAGTVPVGYWLDGEKINFVRSPQSGLSTRIRYYLRPSQLVVSQSINTLVLPYECTANNIRGLIIGVDVATKAITVNQLPYDYVNVNDPLTGVVMASGQAIDVVRPSGWFTPGIVSAATSIAGNVITVAGVSDSDFNTYIRTGDYVRVAEQTDWPALPADYHRLLADATAANILRELDLDDKAEVVSTAASADFARFAKVIQPRTKSEPKSIRQRPYWSRR